MTLFRLWVFYPLVFHSTSLWTSADLSSNFLFDKYLVIRLAFFTLLSSNCFILTDVFQLLNLRGTTPDLSQLVDKEKNTDTITAKRTPYLICNKTWQRNNLSLFFSSKKKRKSVVLFIFLLKGGSAKDTDDEIGRFFFYIRTIFHNSCGSCVTGSDNLDPRICISNWNRTFQTVSYVNNTPQWLSSFSNGVELKKKRKGQKGKMLCFGLFFPHHVHFSLSTSHQNTFGWLHTHTHSSSLEASSTVKNVIRLFPVSSETKW